VFVKPPKPRIAFVTIPFKPFALPVALLFLIVSDGAIEIKEFELPRSIWGPVLLLLFLLLGEPEEHHSGVC
jgi:hypothetical protein